MNALVKKFEQIYELLMVTLEEIRDNLEGHWSYDAKSNAKVSSMPVVNLNSLYPQL